MRDLIVAGNWKMYGSRQDALALATDLKAGAASDCAATLIVFPPNIFIGEVADILQGSNIAWGGQNLSAYEFGAYTGEVAAEMLQDYGSQYVLVGHSERRSLYHEDDALVALKFAHAVHKGLRPILCVGETLEQREQGETESVIKAQIKAVLSLENGVQLFSDAMVAYEPVWAIGTGLTASPEQAQAVHKAIRELIAAHDASIADRLPILYGGSVKPANARDLFAMPDIDGGLVGGASLIAADFLEIAQCTK